MLSMTGYGYLETNEENIDILVEIKSVNNRYCDINIKMPYFLNPYEADIKSMVLKKAQRGKIDVSIFIKDREPNYNITANLSLAKKYYDCYTSVIDELNLRDDVRLSYFLKSDGVISIEDNRDGERFWKILKKYIDEALKQFELSKEREGKETEKHIIECINNIDKLLSHIKKNQKEYVSSYEEKIRTKISDLVGNEFDENRILQEVGIIASKTDIAEEIERLASHIKQFKKIIKKDDAVGRQLEFLSQELNREINTIGAKCNTISISESVIEMKTELEKIKEQIRNIE